MKTRAEIEEIKRQWKADPSWDLKDTGFEGHHDELAHFQETWEARWKQEYEDKLLALSRALGCEGNLALVRHITRLEARLRSLEAHVRELRESR